MDFFRMPNEADMRINELKENKNFLEKLKKSNNKINNLETLNDYIVAKKDNALLTGESFLYGNGKNYNNFLYYNVDSFKFELSKILDVSDYDLSGGNKSAVNGFDAIYDYDYRISLENSDIIKDSDVLEFLRAFNNKSMDSDLSYGIKVMPNEQDLIIIYLKKEDLEKAVTILEELKTNDITRKFGDRKPFTVGMDDKSFYGISMGSTKNGVKSRFSNNMMAKRIEMGKTMTEYSGYLIDKAYEVLLEKYNGRVDMINAEELYVEMHNVHNQYYNFDKEENIPLWMNENIRRSMK